MGWVVLSKVNYLYLLIPKVLYYYNSPLALALYNTHFPLTFSVRSIYRVGREGVFFWFLFRFSFFFLFSLSSLPRVFDLRTMDSQH